MAAAAAARDSSPVRDIAGLAPAGDAASLEDLVTPEQVLSASVARRRRDITKKRSQSGGARPRDATPVRDIAASDADEQESPVAEQPPAVVVAPPPAPQPVTPSETPPETRAETKAEPQPETQPETPRRRGRGEAKPSALKCKNEPPSEEVLSLLNTAKRSVSSHAERSRKPTVEKRAIIKRSQSTPRNLTTDDDDLIESFKKAQRLSAEVGTSTLALDLSSTESIPSTSSEETVERERQELKQKLQLIKKEQHERRSPAAEHAPTPVSCPDPAVTATAPATQERLFGNLARETWRTWWLFVADHDADYQIISSLRNRCISHICVMLIFCGIGGCIFRFTEGAFESFYKCGVKRVKRDFIDALWLSSHNMREDDWKSLARRKLWDFEEQLHAAHEAGVHSYSGQRAWSFLNAVVYCITVVTTIGYGHITPSTTTGRAITIIYAVFGIPMFLILLADFGKLFTRCIKFVWAFVRRLYYTGSCRKVRKTETVQDVMKGVQMVYEIATFRRPSQIDMTDIEVQKPPTLGSPPLAVSESSTQSRGTHLNVTRPDVPGIVGETPNTPAPSNFAVDDEFNLPVSVAIFILILYLLGGAVIYWAWEKWTFFESFYFVFISMSTIGFGDFVPQHPMYMMASILYLVFGLALTSMCINVVQVKLSDTFRQASAKIGATIGLRVADDDGSITHAPSIEIAEVHTAAIQDKTKTHKKDAAK